MYKNERRFHQRNHEEFRRKLALGEVCLECFDDTCLGAKTGEKCNTYA